MGESVAHAGQSDPRQIGKTGLVVATGSDAITINPFDVAVTTPDSQIELNMYDALVDLDFNGQIAPTLWITWGVNPKAMTRERLDTAVEMGHGGRWQDGRNGRKLMQASRRCQPQRDLGGWQILE